MRYRQILSVLLFTLTLAAVAEEPLSRWFADSASAGKYESVLGDLSAVLADAESRNVPVELMMARIAEGAEKRVVPGKLVAALRKDLDNYALILSILSKSTPGNPASRGDWPDLLARGGIALRAGMEASIVESVLFSCMSKSIGPRRAMDALIAVAAVDSRLPLGSEGKRVLALSLASSIEKEARFSLLSPLFLRGKAGRIGARDLVAMAVSTLDSGGGFLQLENEITRRLK